MRRTLAIAVAAAAVGLGGSLDLAAQSQPAPSRTPARGPGVCSNAAAGVNAMPVSSAGSNHSSARPYASA
jgi:hypothetical protein